MISVLIAFTEGYLKSTDLNSREKKDQFYSWGDFLPPTTSANIIKFQ